MRGLIEKDLRLILCRKQTLLIFVVLALVMSLSMEGSFIIGYITMLVTIVSVGTLSYDEFDNGYAFLMTLPFDRKTYAREKFLFCLCMDIAAWCIGTVLYCIGNILRHTPVALADELPMLLAFIPTLFLSAAIMIPLQLKYGSEKSKTVLYVIVGIVAVLLLGSKSLAGHSNNILPGLVEALNRMSPILILLVITAVCALAVSALYLWSVRIMEKKEF